MKKNLVPIDKVIPDANQPRKYFNLDKMRQLKDSVEKHGIVNPLIVQVDNGGRFSIIDGERRYRAAVELGIKEVPIVIIEGKEPIQRLIEQFHIQEQHEGWSPIEKAQVLIELKNQTRKTIKELAEMLSISDRTAAEYMAFEKLQMKDSFTEAGLQLRHSTAIQSVKLFAQKVRNEIDEAFDLDDQKKLEKTMIKQIKSGEISLPRDYTKIKDSFRMDPKLIDVYLKGDKTPEDLYIKSKGRSAFYLRNALIHCGYLMQHCDNLAKAKDIALNEKDLGTFKNTMKHIKGLVDLAE